MNKSHAIRSILGFTQQELALTLSIACSQLSRFENGKQNLPREAMHLLNQFHRYVEHTESDRTQVLQGKKVSGSVGGIRRAIRSNESGQRLLESKIERLQTRYYSQQLDLFIRAQIRDNNRGFRDPVGIANAAAFKAIYERELCSYQIYLKVLIYENTLLEEEFQKAIQGDKFFEDNRRRNGKGSTFHS